MKISKKIARNIIFPTIFKMGADKILRNKSENSILNIMYHGVVNKDSEFFSPRHITKAQFEKHLQYYKREFEIISITEAFHMMRNNIQPKKKAITISFDDGYLNNLSTALPLLEKYGIKTTIFIASVITQDMKIRSLWPDIMKCFVNHFQDETVSIGDFTFKNLIDSSKNISIIDYLKSLPYIERDKVIEDLSDKYELNKKLEKLPKEIWCMLNTEEIKKLSKSEVIDIGSHGHLHYNLANIDPKDAETELRTSKELLESTLQMEVTSIAYPDGSYDSNVKNIAENIGYKNQLAVSYLCNEDYDDLRILSRFGISNTTTFESNMLFLNKSFKTKGF